MSAISRTGVDMPQLVSVPAAPPPSRPAAEAGFSLVEGLIAAALLLLIALGVLPLFTQSMVNNTKGQSSSDVTNLSRSTVEEFLQLHYDSADMTVPAGGTELVLDASYASQVDGGAPVPPYSWQAVPVSGARVLFTRSTTVRQYQVANDIGSTALEEVPLLTAPLGGGADPSFVHFKEIDVEVESARTDSPLGGGSRVRVRVLRPF